MDTEWWRGACIYQIYPRSFLDTSRNGVGDLRGITEKLDYVASLGVDAIWISPFFKSPMKDFGYDVSDYRDVDPLFGSLADFDALLNEAHKFDLKVIIDLVLSHTSDQHPWFQEKPEYYVWADGKNGQPPNNWVSVFGGSAWEWHEERGQYYLHNFLKEQPDLNYHNPDVQREALDICKFWLDRGVDGFRLDVINFLFHDQQLRDNPLRPIELGSATQFEGDDPYSAQAHIYDKSRPEMLPFLKRLRSLMDQYPDKMSLGELGDDNPYELAAKYCAQGILNTTYNPQFMGGRHKELLANLIRTPIEKVIKHGGWPSWAFSNHDVVRAASRWHWEGDGFSHDPKLSKMLVALLGSLRGTLFLYQGDELGLPEARLEYEDLQDPWGKRLWPEWQGRDGCRTPMPWDHNTPNGWLPIPDIHYDLNVAVQERDHNSLLHFTRRFLAWRKAKAAILKGDIIFEDTKDPAHLSFTRTHLNETIRFYFDLKNFDFTIEGFIP